MGRAALARVRPPLTSPTHTDSPERVTVPPDVQVLLESEAEGKTMKNWVAWDRVARQE